MKSDRLSVSDPEIVREGLILGALRSGERHIDLGSGTGVWVRAGILLGATSLGYEIDLELARKCNDSFLPTICAAWEGADVANADLVTFWFSPETAFRVLTKLRAEMKSGSRVVCVGDCQHPWQYSKMVQTSPRLFLRHA